jgi:4,5-DOPA dioxygenase extradiol
MSSSNKMPSLFIGHGSPMNAIETNDYTKMLAQLGEEIPRPKVIVCVLAHWMTKGTWITHQANPKTIHDFHGFPQELFDVQYPAPGNPEWAEKIAELVDSPKIQLDDKNWGFDHGAWAVLRHMYPKADIPCLQLSLDMERSCSYHLEFGKKLRQLREQDVLLVGSGNLVHNLQRIQWDRNAKALPWAIEFDNWIKEKILARDFDPLLEKVIHTDTGKLSIPTWEHYYPLLYILGSSEDRDTVQFEYEGIHNASISMRCLSFGR